MKKGVIRKQPVPQGVCLRKYRKRQGRCYELVLGFILDNRDWNGVHGKIIPTFGPFAGENYDHAWAEKGELLYEVVLNEFWLKEDYHRTFCPSEIKTYNREEFGANVRKFYTCGPWGHISE
jgi:hypothetical protein